MPAQASSKGIVEQLFEKRSQGISLTCEESQRTTTSDTQPPCPPTSIYLSGASCGTTIATNTSFHAQPQTALPTTRSNRLGRSLSSFLRRCQLVVYVATSTVNTTMADSEINCHSQGMSHPPQFYDAAAVAQSESLCFLARKSVRFADGRLFAVQSVRAKTMRQWAFQSSD